MARRESGTHRPVAALIVAVALFVGFMSMPVAVLFGAIS